MFPIETAVSTVEGVVDCGTSATAPRAHLASIAANLARAHAASYYNIPATPYPRCSLFTACANEIEYNRERNQVKETEVMRHKVLDAQMRRFSVSL